MAEIERTYTEKQYKEFSKKFKAKYPTFYSALSKKFKAKHPTFYSALMREDTTLIYEAYISELFAEVMK